jgi:hypothetical protein
VAAPVYQSAGTLWEGNPGSTSLVVAAPAGVANNGIVLAYLYIDTTTTIVTPAAGFTLAGSSPIAASNHRQYIYWKRSTGSEPSNYTFTMSAADFSHSMCHWFSGCITSGSPFDTNFANSVDNGEAFSPPAISITTTADDTLIVYTATNSGTGTWTPPSGFTERQDTGFGLATMDTKAQAVAGSTGSVQAVCSGTDPCTGWIGALLPDAAVLVVAQQSTNRHPGAGPGTARFYLTPQAVSTGGTIWDASPAADNTGITDPVAFEQDLVRTDNAGLTDPLALQQALIRTDDTGLTDAATVQLIKLVTVTDDAGLADGVLVQQALLRTDNAGLTDPAVLTQAKAVTDSAGLTDSTTVVSIKAVDVTDSAGLVDAATLQRALVVTDQAGPTDPTAMQQGKTLTDLAGLTDTTTILSARLVTQTDLAGLTDTVTVTFTTGVSILIGLDGGSTTTSLDGQATQPTGLDGATTTTGGIS